MRDRRPSVQSSAEPGYVGLDDGPKKSCFKTPEGKRPRWLKCLACCLGISLLVTIIGIVLLHVLFPGGFDALVPPTDTNTAPGEPGTPTVYSATATYVGIGWTAPTDDGGATVLLYHVDQALSLDGEPPADGAYSEVATLDSSARTYGGSDLQGDTVYCFRVTAENNVGKGNISAASCFSTLPAEAAQPPENLFPTESTTTSLSIGWNQANGSGAVVEQYTLQTCTTSAVLCEAGSDGDFVDVFTGNSVAHTATELPEASTSWWRVAATTQVGQSPWGGVQRLRTDAADAVAPTEPVPPSEQDITSTSITIQWSEVPEELDGGAQILSYQILSDAIVVLSDGGAPTSKLQPVFEGFALTHTLNDLPANTQYCFTLTVRNNRGESVPSEQTCANTAQPIAPGRPDALWVTSSSTASVDVTWAQAPDNGAATTAYTLQVDNWWTSSTEFSTVPSVVQDQRTAKVVAWPAQPEFSLLPATPLRFRVAATNAIGIGEWSDVMETTTDSSAWCGNSVDMTIFRNSHSTLQGTIQGCIIGCIINPAPVQCAEDCVVREVGFTQDCAACWGALGACTASSCALPCLFPTSAACERCSEDNCFPATVTCTSIPSWAFPRP